MINLERDSAVTGHWQREKARERERERERTGLMATKNERVKCGYKRENGEESVEGEEIQRDKNREIECRRGGDRVGSDWARKRD